MVHRLAVIESLSAGNKWLGLRSNFVVLADFYKLSVYPPPLVGAGCVEGVGAGAEKKGA